MKETGAEIIPEVFQSNKQHPYYIVAPRYIRTSAGTKVLHQLCHVLNALGESAYIITYPYFPSDFAVSPSLKTPVLTKQILNYHFENEMTPITIYPENLPSNYFDAPLVARYFLHYPGFLGGDEVFDEKEYCFSYSKSISEKVPENKKIIFIPSSDVEFFTPPDEQSKRTGSCYYAGKYKYFHGGALFSISSNSIEITRDKMDSQTPDEIRDLFRKCEYFYCFENSALAIEALLCGCVVIFLPNKFFTELIADHELAGLGYSWGGNQSDLENAKKTVKQSRENYINLYGIAIKEILEFIKETQKLAQVTPYLQIMKVPDLKNFNFLRRYIAALKTLISIYRIKGIHQTLILVARRLISRRFKLS